MFRNSKLSITSYTYTYNFLMDKTKKKVINYDHHPVHKQKRVVRKCSNFLQ